MKRVCHDQEGNLILPRLFRVVLTQHVLDIFGIHTGIPRHVRHKQYQRVQPIWILVSGIGNHHVHEAVRGNRRFPRIGFIYAQRVAVLVDHQIFRARGEAQGRAGQRRVRRVNNVDVIFRQLVRRDRFGIGRAGAEITGAVQRAQQHLDQMDRAAGMEAIGVGRNAAHRIHGNRAADDLIVLTTVDISPLDIQFDCLLECDMRHFQRHALNRLGWHATLLGHIGRGIALVEVAFGSQRQHSFHRTAIRCDKVTEQRGGGANFHATHKRLFFQIPYQRGASSVTQKQSIAFLARGLHHQPR